VDNDKKILIIGSMTGRLVSPQPVIIELPAGPDADSLGPCLGAPDLDFSEIEARAAAAVLGQALSRIRMPALRLNQILGQLALVESAPPEIDGPLAIPVEEGRLCRDLQKTEAGAPSAGAMVIGAPYSFKHLAATRLIYLGYNFSGNGSWHQFAQAESPEIVWSELTTGDLWLVEPTPSGTLNPFVVPAEVYEFHRMTEPHPLPVLLETSMGRKRVRSNKGRTARIKAKRRAKRGLGR
jgi:hypothetical protein